MVLIFLEREPWKRCQAQVELPELSLPVALLVNHLLLSAVTIPILELGISSLPTSQVVFFNYLLSEGNYLLPVSSRTRTLSLKDFSIT